MKHILFLIIILLSYGKTVSGQINSFCPFEKDFADTISIEYIYNQIVMPVSINNKTYRFIFDTGVSAAAIIRPNMLPDGSALLKENKMSDATSMLQMKNIYSLTGLSIGKLHFPPCPAVTDSLQKMPWFSCLQIDGFIGGAILQDLSIKIDVGNKQMIITDRKKWFKADKGFDSPMVIIRNCPHINLRLGKIEEKNVLFDTGDNGFYKLSDEVFKQLKAMDPKRWGGEVIDTTDGYNLFGLFGQAGTMSLSLVKIPVWKLGGVTFENIYTVTSPIPVSHIGGGLFQYCNVILNYPDKRLTLLPHADKSLADIDSDTQFSIGLEDGDIAISLVWEHSDAYRQGIRRGDRVKQVNNKPINNDFCTFFEARENGIKHIMVVNAEGEEIEVIISK